MGGDCFLEPAPSKTLKLDLVNVEKEPNKRFDAWKAEGIYVERVPKIAKPGLGALVEPSWPRDRAGSMFRVPAPPDGRGVARVKFSVSSYAAFPEVPTPILWVSFGGRPTDRREITRRWTWSTKCSSRTASRSRGLSVGVTPRWRFPRGERFRERRQVKPLSCPARSSTVWDRRKLREPEQQPRPFLVLKQVEGAATSPPGRPRAGASVGQARRQARLRRKAARLVDGPSLPPALDLMNGSNSSPFTKAPGAGMTFDEACVHLCPCS